MQDVYTEVFLGRVNLNISYGGKELIWGRGLKCLPLLLNVIILTHTPNSITYLHPTLM